MYPCRICPVVAQDFQVYWKHLKNNHEFQSNFEVTCNVVSCKRRFTRLNTFYVHLKNHHRQFYMQNFYRRTPQEQQTFDNEDQDADFVDNDGFAMEDDPIATGAYGEDGDGTVGDTPHFDKEDFVAFFLLELRELNKVSGVACSFVAQHIAKVIETVHKIKSDALIETLKQCDVDNATVLEAARRIKDDISDIFLQFSNMKKLDEYVAEKYPEFFVPPVEINLGYNQDSF